MTTLYILAILLSIQGILGAIYDNGHEPLYLPELPAKSKICEYDAFHASTAYGSKVFLFPWETADQRGSWLRNRGYCAAHCAEMVTIHSQAENQFFLDFMRSTVFDDSGLNAANVAIWLGAQIENKTFNGWTNGEINDYNNPKSTEYNEDGLTCLTAAWSIDNNYWYNYFCDWNNYFVACQRGSFCAPNIAPACYNDNDLIILLDSSGSIGSTNYDTAKEFVNELAKAYKAQSASRVAFYIFSNTVAEVFGLTNTLSASAMSSAILGATYLNSNTATAAGIDAAVAEFIAYPRSVPLNLVVITDGLSNNSTATAEAAENASDNGIVTYSVGVGSSVNQQELLDIANSDSTHVFNAASFDDLVNLLDPISRTVCSNVS